MILNNRRDGARCSDIRVVLSEYIDNTLSARNAWEVEKHLTDCSSCSGEVREMQATVQLLRTAPRFDTSDHFMAALHARLDTVDPSAATGGPMWRRVREWLANAGASVVANRVPALSLGFAAAAITLVLTVNRPVEPGNAAVSAVAASDTVHISIASSASSPFSDPAADNLEFRSGARSAGSAAPF